MSVNLVQYLNKYVYEYTVKETEEVLKFNPITTGQIKGLLTYENDENISAMELMMDDLIRGCVETEGFDLDTLTIQDRFDLLLEIRKKTKGDRYTFIIECPKCKTETINNVDLSALKMVPYPNPLDKIVKISDTLSIELDFVRRGVQKQAFDIADKMTSSTDRQKLVEITTNIYALSMIKFITPNGEISDSSLEDKKKLLDALSSDTYDIINKWYEDNSYGTDFEYEVKCNSCDYKKTRAIPITSFFS